MMSSFKRNNYVCFSLFLLGSTTAMIAEQGQKESVQSVLANVIVQIQD